MQKMDKEYLQNSLDYWNGVHKPIKRDTIPTDDWLELFDDMIQKCSTPVLDLGCGTGNDTLTLIQKGKQVISCDQSENAINNIRNNFPEVPEAKCFNMLEGLPFEDGSFELVIADLCLHYFPKKDTRFLISEIGRILKSGGHLLFRVNSINDTNHGAGQGTEIEHHLFVSENHTLKRFFDEDDIRDLFGDYKIEYLKEEIMTRYKLEKRLFRVCCQKE